MAGKKVSGFDEIPDELFTDDAIIYIIGGGQSYKTTKSNLADKLGLLNPNDFEIGEFIKVILDDGQKVFAGAEITEGAGVCISVVQSDGSFANLINTTGENVTWTKDSDGEYTHRGNVRLVSVTPFTADPTDITKWGININAENQVRFYNFDNRSVDAVFIALLIKT